MVNNVPVQRPLYPSDGMYGSDRFESVAVLARADAEKLQAVLHSTPFRLAQPFVWIEVMVLRTAFGLAPFGGGGVIIPATYRDMRGGYYAFCYVDTDDTLALGREAWGYPKKLAGVILQKTGRAATARMRRNDVDIQASVVLDTNSARPELDVPRYPHLLYQVLPSADNTEALLKRVIARNTAASSAYSETIGEGAVTIAGGPLGNELECLGSLQPVYGIYSCGSFTSGPGRVLGTEHVGSELRNLTVLLR